MTNEGRTDAGRTQSRGHPDDEVLSAHLDTETAQWAAHVDACGECSARLRALASARDAVAVTVEVPVGVRERVITAALAAYDDTLEGRPEPDATPEPAPVPASVHQIDSPRRRGLATVVSVAAVLLALVGTAGVLTRGGGSGGGNQALSSRDAAEDAATANAATPGGGEIADLGEIADANALLARLTAADTGGGSTGQTSAVSGPATAEASATNTGETGDATAIAGSAPSPSPPLIGAPGAIEDSAGALSNSGARSEAVAGPTGAAEPKAFVQPGCEQEVRTSHPGAGDIVYRATARHLGQPALVFGLRPTPGPADSPPPPLTLLMVARDGCRPLLEAVAP